MGVVYLTILVAVKRVNDEKVYQKCRNKPKSIHSKEVKQLLDLKISIGPAFKDEYIKLDLPSDNSSPTIL